MRQPTIQSMQADLRAGRVTPTDLAAQALERLAALDDPAVVISAFTLDELVAQARSAPKGALWGIPFMVKDNIDVAGLPTTAGCPAFSYQPTRSATVVERLQAAGAIAVAKTNLDQFATGLVGTRSPYGAPRNVLDPTRVPGGSSSGSAVAVAAGIVPFALGTDTAGSGRVPAALNGITGAKPTRGWLSTTGVVPAVRSIDCVSVFSLVVEDAWKVLVTAGGPDATDVFSRLPTPHPAVHREMRIGIGAPVPACMREALETMGLVSDVDVTPYLEAGNLLYGSAFVAERDAAVGEFIAAHPRAVEAVVRDIILGSRRWTAADLARGRYELARLRRGVDAIWTTVDVLVLPTVDSHPTLEAEAAEPMTVNSALGRYTAGTNLCDLSAVTVPGHHGDLGVQLIGPAWADAQVAGLAARVHAATDRGITLAVVGAHLRGQPLHHQLTAVGAEFAGQTTTAPEYRLYALAETMPAKPGLVRVMTGGAAIEVETYRLTAAAFGAFVAAVPMPLCIGSVRLGSGSIVSGFLCEPSAVEGATDITRYGGWRAYRAQ